MAAGQEVGMGENADEEDEHRTIENEDYQKKRREALEVIEKLRALGIECELAEDLTVVRKHPPN
jgi:hypothetical protein